MTAKEVIINLIDKGLINGEEAFELMDAISTKKTECVPYKEPFNQPYTSPWITWYNTNESVKYTSPWIGDPTTPPYTITATNNLQNK